MSSVLAQAVAPPSGRQQAKSGGLLSGSLAYGSVTLLAYAVSMAKAIAVGRIFGTGVILDAYTLAILAPNVVGALLLSTAAGTIVPALSQADAVGERSTVFRSSFTFFLFVTLALTVVLQIFAKPLTQLMGAALDPQRVAMAVSLAPWAAPIMLLTGIYAYCSAELLSRRKFALAAGAPALGSALSLGMILIWRGRGAQILMTSLLAGLLLQAACVLAPGLHATSGGSLFDWKNKWVRRSMIGQLSLLGAAITGAGNNFIDQLVSTKLPAGNVSALTYSSTLHNIVTQIVAMALGTAVLPEFAAIVAAKQPARLSLLLRRCIVASTLIAAPITVGIILFGRFAIHIVFEGGHFNAQSTSLVSLGWIGYSLGLIPLAIGILVARVINALDDNVLLLRIGVAMMVLNAVLDLVYLRFFGLLGIALSTSTVYCVSMFLALLAAHRHVGRVLDSSTSRKLGGILCVAAGNGVAMWYADRWFISKSIVAVPLEIFIFMGLVVAGYRLIGLLEFKRSIHSPIRVNV